jgi:hypothetical protein
VWPCCSDVRRHHGDGLLTKESPMAIISILVALILLVILLRLIS